MELNFKKIEESRANKVFLVIRYMSGDADAFQKEEYYLDELEGDSLLANDENQLIILEKEIGPYKTLKNILDINHKDYLDDYNKVKEKYSNEIATLYDNAPYDVTCDEYKQALRNIYVLAYSSDGSKYESYIF